MVTVLPVNASCAGAAAGPSVSTAASVRRAQMKNTGVRAARDGRTRDIGFWPGGELGLWLCPICTVLITVLHAAYRFTNADCHPSTASPTPADRTFASTRRYGRVGGAGAAGRSVPKRPAARAGRAILTQGANHTRKIDSRSGPAGFDYWAAKKVCCVIAAGGHLFLLSVETMFTNQTPCYVKDRDGGSD